LPISTVSSVEEVRAAMNANARAVVVLPVYNAPDETRECFESILRHTPVDVAILLVDDRGPDRSFFDSLASRFTNHRVTVLEMPSNGGFVGACNAAFAATSPHDVIVVNSDVVVGPEWYERMCDAAASSTDIATVSVFTNNGTILSLPHRNMPWPDIVGGLEVDEAARRVAAASLRTRPAIPTAVGHCFLVKRAALDLVGGFDSAFGKGYGEEVDLSQRLIRLGLRHVVADDVFVFHKGSASFTDAARDRKAANDAEVDRRYPWYPGMTSRAASDPHSPLAAAINRASMHLRKPSIAVDGHCFGWSWAGTQRLTFELIQAMAEARPDHQFTVLFSEHAPTSIVDQVCKASNVSPEIVTNIMKDRRYRFDVIIRPHQVNSHEELRWMKRIAGRCIVGQLDFIAHHNPAYFASDHEWLSMRELTRLTLGSVDGVFVISRHVLDDARRSGVLDQRIPWRVTHMGVDHRTPDASPRRPAGLPDDVTPIISLLGVDYLHKNRPFAISLLIELAERGVACRLVLAGPTAAHGTSATEEARLLSAHPEIVERVVKLGALDESEKDWLVRNSALVLYPTLAEGFGLVPFEAALAGVPCLSTRMASLDEVLPHDIPTIDTFDPSEVALQVESLLGDSPARTNLVNSLRRRAGDFTWERAAAETLALVDEVAMSARNPLDAVWGEAPVPSQIHSADYVEREQRAARIGQRVASANRAGILRLLVGGPGSRRRQLVKRVPFVARRLG